MQHTSAGATPSPAPARALCAARDRHVHRSPIGTSESTGPRIRRSLGRREKSEDRDGFIHPGHDSSAFPGRVPAASRRPVPPSLLAKVPLRGRWRSIGGRRACRESAPLIGCPVPAVKRNRQESVRFRDRRAAPRHRCRTAQDSTSALRAGFAFRAWRHRGILLQGQDNRIDHPVRGEWCHRFRLGTETFARRRANRSPPDSRACPRAESHAFPDRKRPAGFVSRRIR